MPKFGTEVVNPLGKEKATEKLKHIIDQLSSKFQDQVSDVTQTWEDNVLNFSLKTYGFTVSGELTVEDEAVRLDGTLPMAAMMFRKKLEDSIAGELQKLLT